MSGHQYDNSSQRNSDEDMTVDVDERSIPPTRTKQSECKSEYHQNEATTWKLPSDPWGEYYQSDHKPPVQPGRGYYRNRCRMIRSSWKTDNPQDWLPTEMLECTPYSLALLCSLSFLAVLTKNQKDDAHKALLEARAARLATPTTQLWMTTQCNSHLTEDAINENTSGIVLIDVHHATSFVRQAKETAKKQKHAEQANTQGASAVKRVVERREKKRQDDIRLQRELWKEQGNSVQLVGLEYSNGDAVAADAHSEPGPNDTTFWQMLKRQAQESRKLGKTIALQRQHREDSIQTLPKPAAAKLTRLRARTVSEMKDELNEEDLSWDDSEDEQDITDIDPSKPDVRNIPESKKEKKAINQLANAIESSSGIETVVKTNRRGKKKDKHREQKKAYRAREAAKVLARAKANSIRLPSEIMDFSAIGKLQPVAHNDDMTSMTGALNGIL